MRTDKIRALDMSLIDDLLAWAAGMFSTSAIGRLPSSFPTNLTSTLITQSFSAEGTSKAKRLRYFLRTSDSSTRVRVLKAEEKVPDAQSEFDRLIARVIRDRYDHRD